ncbi:polyunsaturated fatty acid lipoxygenase ALOX15B-like isoform X2 [Talpa occidentalis]|uniref:polyunsaturated fatty acid lipoxygenase ALOX15B-like isoform X2 n=1 Tax=Talpa occidentalis TaxID=50954 RepID=UPI00189034F9|nr:polyunsaturated fatty acid lipoxygenase ALOX15B-like isoform X2 [Talpa occidentalis]
MAEFRVRVSTGEAFGAGTWDRISISIVGTRGETPPLPLDRFGKEFTACAEEDFEVTSPQDVGPVLLLRVHKAPPKLPRPLGPLAPDAWFCRWFQLTPPRGAPLRFPCYQWLEGSEGLVLREGAGKVPCADHHPALQQQRKEELKLRQEIYGWKTYIPGWPHCLNEDTVKHLNINIKYSLTKNTNFYLKGGSAFAELKIKGLLDRKGPWKSLKEMRKVFNFRKTPAAEYVFEHWQEDAFFASQFLNGLNPVLIRCCRCLPKNFPVTDAMVAPVLGPGTCLQAELERGSLFLVDHGILSGIRPNVVNGRPQFSAAPMTLLYQRPGCGPLLPLAIQLNQNPGSNSPIFLPTDNQWDWLLAKTWVRNAEFTVHEAITHLLHEHLLPEVFTLATLRQLPHCHPLFKSTGLGIGGFSELIKRNMEQLTYSSLCLPEDIRARGVEDIPGYFYRDDGIQIWGLPSSLETQEALVKYVTMVIFNCSAKHSAVSAGQFDSCAWMPNLPPTMQLPPPTSKGQGSPEGFIATLPPVSATCDVIIALWVLSKEPGERRPLGTYPDEHFTEEAPRRSITAFQSRLAQISRDIQVRNQDLPLPYVYLDPPLIENSVSI